MAILIGVLMIVFHSLNAFLGFGVGLIHYVGHGEDYDGDAKVTQTLEL